MGIFTGLKRDIVFLQSNIISKEGIAVKAAVDIALMAMIPKQILNNKTKGSARFLRFMKTNKLDEFKKIYYEKDENSRHTIAIGIFLKLLYISSGFIRLR